MGIIKNYIQGFLNRSGGLVFLANIISRCFSFLISWIVVQLISDKELGIVLYTYNIVMFILPFAGLGLYQSLVRYAPFLKSKEEKTNLFNYVLRKGLVISAGLLLLVLLVGLFIPFKLEETNYYLVLISLVIIPDFVFQVLKIRFRIFHDNKSFAIAEIVYSSTLLVLVTILSFQYQEQGYALAIVLTPLIVALLFLRKIKNPFIKVVKPSIVNGEFWRYGFFAGISSFTGQLILIVDVLLIGSLIENPEYVTIYRYVSIVPLSTLFLPQVFMNTDFVMLTENILDKNYVFKYIKSYLSFFSIIAVGVCVVGIVCSEYILAFFDESFLTYKESLIVLIIGVTPIIAIRVLFGNLLSSIGKITANLYIFSIAIVFNIVGNWYFIPEYGVYGVAIISAISMWFTSLATMACFFFLYKGFVKKEYIM